VKTCQDRNEATARRVARFYRRWRQLYRATFAEEYRGNAQRDAEYLIHHVEADCCGRVEWAVAVASGMLDDPAVEAGSFRSIWLADQAGGSRSLRARLRVMVRESAAEVASSNALGAAVRA